MKKKDFLNPARLPGNDYRDYTEQDIRTLRFIRMLRMLDAAASGHPIRACRRCIAGAVSCGSQKTALEQRAKQLEGAARFCAELARQDPSVASLDVDACLTRMEKPAVQGTFCSGWLQDYRTLAQVQHQRHFSFIPEGSINTPQEFTAALQTYAKANGMQFSLEKEGMYPEFSLDGIPYKAYRNPGKYRDEICCDAVHPEQLDTGLPSRRGKAAAHRAYRAAAGVHLCRHHGGRVGSHRRCRLALAGGAGIRRGCCWGAAWKSGCKAHHPSGRASATVKKV